MNLNFSKEEMFPDSSSPPPGCCLLISKLPAYNLCCIETHLAVYAPLLPGDWNHLLWTRCLVELLYYRYIDNNKGGSVIQQVATETELSLWRRMSATVLVHKDTLFFNMFLSALSVFPSQIQKVIVTNEALTSCYLNCGPTRWSLSGSPPFPSDSNPGEITPRSVECCLVK